jgi:hypothetical protein
MAITTTDLTTTIGTTETSLVTGSAYASGSPQTDNAVVQVVLDVSALAAGDEFLISIYERVQGGTQRAIATWPIAGAQSELWISPALVLTDGWDVAAKKLAGTDRAIRSSVRRIA